VLCLFIACTFSDAVPPAKQIGRAVLGIVSITRNKVDAALIEHPFRPVPGVAAKRASKSPCGDLHPGAGADQPPDHLIAGGDPRQPLGMGENGHITRNAQAEEEFLQLWRRGVVGRLNQHVAGIGN